MGMQPFRLATTRWQSWCTPRRWSTRSSTLPWERGRIWLFQLQIGNYFLSNQFQVMQHSIGCNFYDHLSLSLFLFMSYSLAFSVSVCIFLFFFLCLCLSLSLFLSLSLSLSVNLSLSFSLSVSFYLSKKNPCGSKCCNKMLPSSKFGNFHLLYRR